MELRVEQLAGRADVSVDTIRFYQSRGLLSPPRRQGRVALYGAEHVDRLARIRRLQARGLTLTTIKRLLDGDLDAADEALVTAVAQDDPGPPATFTLDEMAERSGIPIALLRAVEKEGLLVPRGQPGQPRYSEADIDAARAGLALLEQGLPLSDLLALARDHHQATKAVAERAVALFDDHVRGPLRDAGLDDEEAAARLVRAFLQLLPATTTLVTHHFRRTLLAAAQDHIDRVGGPAEREAVEATWIE